jgi:protocatechuate 3,4-dioxygenase beta subunit
LSVSIGLPMAAVANTSPVIAGKLFPGGGGGATSAVATQLKEYLPQQAQVGTPATVELVALNARNEPVSSFSDTVALSSTTDPTAAFSPTSVTFKNGYASFQVTFDAIGSQSVTATDTTNSSLTVTASTKVVAPPVATQLKMSFSPGATAGSPETVELVALTASNQPVSSFTDTVTLSSTTDTTAVFSPTSVTFKDGRASFQVTFDATGSQSVTATDTSNSALTLTASTTVAAAPVASQLKMYFLSTNVQTGSPVTVEMVALDAQNRLVTSYADTVKLSSTTDTTAVFAPTSVTFKNGIGTFQVTFDATGSQSVTATDTTNSSLTVTASTTVVAPPVATQLKMNLPKQVFTGVPVTVQLVALDASNQPVPNYTGTVKLSSTTDSTAVFAPTSVTFKNGYATFQVTFDTLGSQSATATDTSNSALTVTGSTTVVAAPVATKLKMYLPEKVPEGVPVTVELVALDANGIPVPTYTGTVKLSSSTDSTAVFSPTSVTFKNGFAMVQVTFDALGSQSITATDTSNSSLTVTASTTVVTSPWPTPGGGPLSIEPSKTPV